MKIQIDTNLKTIKVEEKVNMKEFMSAVKKLFPEEKWEEYSLETSTIINWSSPIYVEPYRPWVQPYPWINYCNGSSMEEGLKYNNTVTSNTCLYNVEVTQ